MQVRLRKVTGANQFFYLAERKEGGRIVRYTSPRMNTEETRERLRQLGFDENQIDAELRSASGINTL